MPKLMKRLMNNLEHFSACRPINWQLIFSAKFEIIHSSILYRRESWNQSIQCRSSSLETGNEHQRRQRQPFYYSSIVLRNHWSSQRKRTPPPIPACHIYVLVASSTCVFTGTAGSTCHEYHCTCCASVGLFVCSAIQTSVSWILLCGRTIKPYSSLTQWDIANVYIRKR